MTHIDKIDTNNDVRRWFSSRPNTDLIRQVLVVGFLESRDAYTSENAISEDEMEIFLRYVNEAIMTVDLLSLMLHGLLSCRVVDRDGESTIGFSAIDRSKKAAI